MPSLEPRKGLTSALNEIRFAACRVCEASFRTAASRDDTRQHASVAWSRGGGNSSEGR